MKAIRIVQSLTLAGLAVAGLVTMSAGAFAEGTTESSTLPAPPMTCIPVGVPTPGVPAFPTLPTRGVPSDAPGVPGNPINCEPAGAPGIPAPPDHGTGQPSPEL